jgi:hypothetical protein
VEHDDIGSNGASNRAIEAGRVVGIDDDGRTHGIMGRAQAGTNISRPTPYGSAGRIRVPAPAMLRVSNAPLPMGQSTRGGTPLGAPPKAGVPVGRAEPRLSAPAGFPGTPDLADRAVDGPVVDLADMPEIFATPAGAAAQAEVVVDEDEEDTGAIEFDIDPAHDGLVIVEESEEVSYDDDHGEDLQDEMPTVLPTSPVPGRTPVGQTVGRIRPQDGWLTDAISRANALGRSLPAQATIELSREPHLPFTLVITRATPALAVRAMVSFVEFLANISTPPRARIELVGVAHLDRSFYKNVVAALDPYFGADSVVAPSAGVVDIRFTNPDPGWGDYPRLPA